MGVIIQPLSTPSFNQDRALELSLEMERLFSEFLGRYQEWQSYQKRELGWFMAAMVLGLGTLTLWMESTQSWAVNAIVLLAFIAVLNYYLKIRQLVNHTYVNVHILHHHLLGKLDVGFCHHQSPCQCSEQFKNYVWKHYKISLYGDSL